MDQDQEPKLIWLIDRRDYWRDRCARVLADAGYMVRPWSRYDFPPQGSMRRPSLVILGCTQVEDPERRLVEEVRARGDRLVVLASSISAPLMRSLFLAGAEDVVVMPGRADQLVALVAEWLGPAAEPDSVEAHLHAGV